MHVLMPVEVRHPDTRRRYLLKLSANFGFQIDQPNSPPNQRFQQFEWMMVQKAARVGEAWNSIERSHRASLCQIQVKAGIEPRIPLEDIDGRFKGAAVDDQACCRHNSVSMRLLDGLIDPPRKP